MKKMALLLLLASSFTFANDDEDCEKGATTMGEVRMCYLDNSYNAVLSQFDIFSSLAKKKSNQLYNYVRSDQKSWLEYRNNSCRLQVNVMGHGTMDDEAACIVELDNARIKTLKRYISALKSSK